MSAIYISYSTDDKKFAKKLTKDLEKSGHKPWLDEWEIKVGDSIHKKLEEGIANADFVVVILSPNAVQSGWVDNEWRAKHWEEIKKKEVLVLPVLLRDCEIPTLLKTKKYADFRKDHSRGIAQLMAAINPVIKDSGTEILTTDHFSQEVSGLITEVQSQKMPLSQSISKALDIAVRAKNKTLKEFCENELTGWPKNLTEEEAPSHRKIKIFTSLHGQINIEYIGWKSAKDAINFMEKDEGFIPYQMFIGLSVSEIESSLPSHSDWIMSIELKAKDFLPDSKTPDTPVYTYAKPDTYSSLLGSTRKELTKQLIELLPKIAE